MNFIALGDIEKGFFDKTRGVLGSTGPIGTCVKRLEKNQKIRCNKKGLKIDVGKLVKDQPICCPVKK